MHVHYDGYEIPDNNNVYISIYIYIIEKENKNKNKNKKKQKKNTATNWIGDAIANIRKKISRSIPFHFNVLHISPFSHPN